VDLFDPKNKKAETFLRQSNYAKVYAENLSVGLRRLAPRLWNRLSDCTQACSFYLIEAKNGLLEVPLLKAMIERRGSMTEIYLTCQGTSAGMREEFSQRAIESGLKNFSIEYQVIRFEEPLYIQPRVNIAIAPYEWLDITSWKNTPREHNSLVKFRNSLHHNGVGVMVFPCLACDRFLLLQKWGRSSSLIAGEEVVEELLYHEIRHQAYIVETKVNTESCFQESHFDPTEQGELLLSYLLHVDWKSLSEQIKKNIGIKITELRAHYGKPQMILQHLFVWIFPGTPRKRDVELVTDESLSG